MMIKHKSKGVIMNVSHLPIYCTTRLEAAHQARQASIPSSSTDQDDRRAYVHSGSTINHEINTYHALLRKSMKSAHLGNINKQLYKTDASPYILIWIFHTYLLFYTRRMLMRYDARMELARKKSKIPNALIFSQAQRTRAMI